MLIEAFLSRHSFVKQFLEMVVLDRVHNVEIIVTNAEEKRGEINNQFPYSLLKVCKEGVPAPNYELFHVAPLLLCSACKSFPFDSCNSLSIDPAYGS